MLRKNINILKKEYEEMKKPTRILDVQVLVPTGTFLMTLKELVSFTQVLAFC
jgi:hypothetical protein